MKELRGIKIHCGLWLHFSNGSCLHNVCVQSSNEEYISILKRSHSPLDEGSNMISVQEWWQQGSHNGTTVYDLFLYILIIFRKEDKSKFNISTFLRTDFKNIK